ncbi:replication initiation protein [Thiomicrolovo sp. ZZH C-3]
MEEKDKQPIEWSLKDQDPYYRVSNELYDADVEYEEGTSSNNASERLSKTTLKAIQDIFYNREKERGPTNEDAEKLTEEIFERYCAIRKSKLLARFNRMAELPMNGSGDKLVKVDEQLDAEKDELYRLAAKEAWRTVNIDSIPEEDLTLRFYASPIAKVANITNLSSTNLFEEVAKLQSRFNRWTEKAFDEESGEIIFKKYRTTLLPTAILYQRGKGHRNFIEVKLNRSMLHLVMFLRRNYLRFHLEISVAFDDQKTSKLYEEIVKMITLKRSGAYLSIELAKKLMGTTMKQTGVFKKRHIINRVNQINDRLNTSIVVEDVKHGRRIIGYRFIASDLDKQLLLGERASSDFFREDILFSFGYYLALLEYHRETIPKSRIGIRAIELENDVSPERLETEYQDYKANLMSYHQLCELPEEDYPEGYSLDIELMTLVNERGVPYSKFAYGCMLKISSELQSQRQNSLPGLDDRAANRNWELGIRDLIPFWFAPPGQERVSITDENFGQYQKRIEVAIKFKDTELFSFDDASKQEFFEDKIVGGQKPTIDAEVIDAPAAGTAQSAKDVLTVLPAFRAAFEAAPAKWNKILPEFDSRIDDVRILVDHLSGDSGTARSNLAWMVQPHNFVRDFDTKLAVASSGKGSGGSGAPASATVLDAEEVADGEPAGGILPELAEVMYRSAHAANDKTRSVPQRWLNTFERILEIDDGGPKYEAVDVGKVVYWLHKEGRWWLDKVLSPAEFSKKFARLLDEAGTAAQKGSPVAGLPDGVNLLDALKETE